MAKQNEFNNFFATLIKQRSFKNFFKLRLYFSAWDEREKKVVKRKETFYSEKKIIGPNIPRKGFDIFVRQCDTKTINNQVCVFITDCSVF